MSPRTTVEGKRGGGEDPLSGEEPALTGILNFKSADDLPIGLVVLNLGCTLESPGKLLNTPYGQAQLN